MEQPHRISGEGTEQKATELFVEQVPQIKYKKIEYDMGKIYFSTIDFNWLNEIIKEINNKEDE